MSARLVGAALTALALLLASCGGDSGGGGEPAGSGATSGGQAGTSDSAVTTEPAPRKRRQGGGEDQPQIDLDKNRQPLPKGSVPPDERTDQPPAYTPQAIPKEQLKAIERPIYEQSRYICKRLGVDGMRREYRIESTDPEEVARGVAERTYQRAARDAVYSGCLAGLRSGD